MKNFELDINIATSDSNLTADGWMYVLPITGELTLKDDALAKKVPTWLREEFVPLAKKRKFVAKVGASLAFDGAESTRLSLVCMDPTQGMFEWLTTARKTLSAAAIDAKVKHLAIDLRGCSVIAAELADAFTSAAGAALYTFPKYKGPKKPDAKKDKADDENESLELTFIVERAKSKAVETAASRALTTTTAGTNLVRWLAKRAGNDLTCKSYVAYTRDLAKQRKWKFEHLNHDKLKQLKAGAFLAVVQGSEHKDYGIVKLTYTPPKASKHLVLVGKGLIFDTGGHSLKPSAYMLGMHGDMGGSAVALSVLNVATLQKWPTKITAYLAIADNMIGPQAYKPNDVVTAMNGTTIEIIDTDAEGRMVLSDTLYLASKEKADLMMDFATLTGSCVKAIGTTFSGVFTNRSQLHGSLIESGYACGERVWPFPMDADFANCLDSTSADTKQCREKGGVDHIEASQFLMRFAGKETPWVHVDLSSIENAGGLAHVASDETGFGVRFASEFARKNLKI